MGHSQTKIPKLMMSVVLQNFYLNVDYLEILTIYDILAGQVSGKFCIDLTRPWCRWQLNRGSRTGGQL